MFGLIRLKPPHGWSAVVLELAIVTLGVLIALGAQEAVQALSDRAGARQARTAIRGELQTNMARLASRSAIRNCVARRLDEIQGLLDGAAQSQRIATPRWVGRAQYWTMQLSRWEALTQAGRAALLPNEELTEYAQMHHWMRNINAEMITEQADWAQLRTLEHLRTISPDALFQLNATLQDARYRTWRISQQTALLVPIARSARLATVRNDIPAPRSVCLPMDTPRAEGIRLSGSPYGEP